MPVFAMTREMGTRGKDVARDLADALGLELMHQELVERHLAERMHLRESAVHRFLEGRPSLADRWNVDRKQLLLFTAEEVLQFAAKGKVLIRGWGAAQLLSDVSHVVCARICAPMSNRITEMSQRLGIKDHRVLQSEIEANDDAHARAVQRQFSLDWRDPSHYDIVLNTARLPIDACVAQLRRLADLSAFQETAQSRDKLTSKIIEARVRNVLDVEAADLPQASSLKVAVAAGTVTLTGVVSGMRVHRPAIDSIRQIEGVLEVRDEVVVVRKTYGL